MRALTLTQPWCGLVAAGIKLVENRPRSLVKPEDFGKPFALHASREIDESVYEQIHRIAPELFHYQPATAENAHATPTEWYRLSRITSAVIAIATLDRAVRGPAGGGYVIDVGDGRSFELGEQQRWYFGSIGYVLRDVRALATPVPCRGFQGFWTLKAETQAQVAGQLLRAA